MGSNGRPRRGRLQYCAAVARWWRRWGHRCPGVLTLWLVVASVGGCSQTDASAPAEHSNKTAASKKSRESGDAGTAVDLSAREFPLLAWAVATVEQEYFDAGRFEPRAQLLSALTALGLHEPEFFADVEGATEVVEVRVRSARSEFPIGQLSNLNVAASRLEEILSFTQQTLDLDPEPLHELEYAAINGMFAPLDPHTILLTPEEHSDLGVRTRGQFGGIGAQIRAEARRILIVRTLPNMPAELAGVRDGDVILTIDDESTVNMSAQEAQQRLRGPIGSEVVLKIRRGKTSSTITIERSVIRLDSVTSAELPDGIGYLRISNFQENTSEQVKRAIDSIPDLRGLVVDLRGNSGGLLAQATAVVDQLVGSGELVIVRSAAGREADLARPEVALPAEVSVVALIDEQSASAAEIVSGGIRALGRGVVLGRSSFGKGTVQMVRPAAPYGRELALKFTVAEYLVAGDQKIQTLGVPVDLRLLPVELGSYRGIARYFDTERFERERERSRVANLPSAKHEHADGLKLAPPAATVRYLWDNELPAGLPNAKDLPDEMRDAEIRIARRVALAVAGVADKSQRLAAAKTTARRVSTDEDRRITAALAKTKVDWAPETPVAPSAPTMKASLLHQGPVKAGEPFSLRVEVRNPTDHPIARAHIITDCVQDELDGIELLIGTIGPREVAIRDLKLQVMPWHSNLTDSIAVDLHVGEPQADPVARDTVMFEVESAPMPALAYDYWLVDDPVLAKLAPSRPEQDPIPGEPAFSVAGNGDGVLQRGERVLLAFVARNDGPGHSPDVRAVLRNLSGKQGLIEEGIVVVGALGAGEHKSGAFGITVADTADPSVPFELDLQLGDATRRVRAADKLRLRVLPNESTFEPEPVDYDVVGESVRLFSGAHPSSKVVGIAPVGVHLATIGRFGPWRVLLDSGGRRLFVPETLPALRPRAESAATDFDKLFRTFAVLPPAIVLEGYARVTSASDASLHGVVSHPKRVHDVMVLVKPPGVSQVSKKILYQAASGDAKSLAFDATVPLAPGGNRVTVLARDAAKVVRRKDVWIYREPQAQQP